MVLFEGKAFDEDRIVYISVDDNFNSRKVYCDSNLNIFFIPGTLPYNNCSLHLTFSSNKQAISKMTELVTLINDRKDRFLKPTD